MTNCENINKYQPTITIYSRTQKTCSNKFKHLRICGPYSFFFFSLCVSKYSEFTSIARVGPVGVGRALYIGWRGLKQLANHYKQSTNYYVDNGGLN